MRGYNGEMAIEIEAKIKVADLGQVAARLRGLGARERGRVVQRDWFFDRADGSMRRGDVGLRLREETGADGVKTVMCYKGPRLKGRYKEREEIEFTLSDAEQGREFLAALGFEATLAFEKRRWLWELQGCEVCLDEVVELGAFVEVEGPGEQQVHQTLAALGLKETEHIAESYVTMLARRQEEMGRQSRGELFFGDKK